MEAVRYTPAAEVTADSACVDRIHPSPNHGERAGGRRPDALVLHYTGMKDAVSALHQLCNPLAQVSAHYFVFEDGRIFQLVPESRRAWHAGRGSWQGDTDMNSASIGIEIVNPGHQHGYGPFPEIQIERTIALCRGIVDRWSISADRVIAHSDMAPDRKEDPGELFPWDRLAAAGVGLFVPPTPISGGRFLSEGDQGQPVEALQAMLAMLGYAQPITGVYDAALRLTVTAFQRHFRQSRVDGIADQSTITTLHRLLQARPERGG